MGRLFGRGRENVAIMPVQSPARDRLCVLKRLRCFLRSWRLQIRAMAADGRPFVGCPCPSRCDQTRRASLSAGKSAGRGPVHSIRVAACDHAQPPLVVLAQRVSAWCHPVCFPPGARPAVRPGQAHAASTADPQACRRGPRRAAWPRAVARSGRRSMSASNTPAGSAVAAPSSPDRPRPLPAGSSPRPVASRLGAGYPPRRS